MDTPKLEAIARNMIIAANSIDIPTRQLAEALAAYEEAAMRAALARIEEDEKRDPFAELLAAMEEVKERCLLDELAAFAEAPADLDLPRKTPRPPKRLGPLNKANHTTNRPPRRARSSCYIRRH